VEQLGAVLDLRRVWRHLRSRCAATGAQPGRHQAGGLSTGDVCNNGYTGPTCDFVYTGYRVPLVVVSPYAKKNYVSHTVTDYTGILKFIETRFNIPSLTKRDAAQEDMTEYFRLQHSTLDDAAHAPPAKHQRAMLSQFAAMTKDPPVSSSPVPLEAQRGDAFFHPQEKSFAGSDDPGAYKASGILEAIALVNSRRCSRMIPAS